MKVFISLYQLFPDSGQSGQETESIGIDGNLAPGDIETGFTLLIKSSLIIYYDSFV
jgi:hypothetical protein